MIQAKKRIKWLDFAKGISILFVIIAHCAYIGRSNLFINILGYISFIFVMPLFFSISGFLYKKISSMHSYLLLIYKKVTSILIPYLIFSFGSYIFEYFQGQKLPILYMIKGFRIYGILWFLLSLFLVFIITGLCNLIEINLIIPFSLIIIVTIISSNFWTISNGLTHSHIYFIFSYFIFFYLGIFIKRYVNLKFIKSTKFLITAILVFLLLSTIQLDITGTNYETNPISIFDIFTKLISVFALFSIFMNISEKNYLFGYFSKYGKYTLCIYLVHYFILSILSIFRNYAYPVISFVLIVMITWIICILVYKISNKFKVLNFIFYPRKYINALLSRTKFGRYLFRLND